MPLGIATVVKDSVGRKRYIVFRVEGGEDLETSEVIQALREVRSPLLKPSSPFLVSYDRGVGIVRCPHTEKEGVIKVLCSVNSIGSREVHVSTLGTSGTLRRAHEKYVKPRLEGGSQD